MARELIDRVAHARRAAGLASVVRATSLIALGLIGACHRDAPAKVEVASAGSGNASGAALAEKAFYRVDRGAQPACNAGATCEAQLVLTALGGFHINKDYPFKFVGDPAAAALEGPATFALDGEKRGTLTIKFRPQTAGTAKLGGTFKLSVCSDDNCEIDTPRLELSVPVS
jgi:hypothetical protein